MTRKNLLSGLMGDKLPAGNPPADPAAARPATPAPRGAVGAVTRSFEHLKSQIGEARHIQTQLAAGAAVVELDPARIDVSFAADRLPRSALDDAELIQSIKASGQQVPILVRPHPSTQGRYQVAFGHRRLRAAAALGVPVKAVVRSLSDTEVVVAQGQENSARTDLSFIERALFAQRLETRGFARETIMAALSIDKTVLSKLISAATLVPRDLIEVIGPAPKAGRDRWLALAARLRSAKLLERARQVAAFPEFSRLPSDERFLALLKALAPKKSAAKSAYVVSARGKRVARLVQNERQLSIIIDRRAAPVFADFLSTHLQEIFDSLAKPGVKPGG